MIQSVVNCGNFKVVVTNRGEGDQIEERDQPQGKLSKNQKQKQRQKKHKQEQQMAAAINNDISAENQHLIDQINKQAAQNQQDLASNLVGTFGPPGISSLGDSGILSQPAVSQMGTQTYA